VLLQLARVRRDAALAAAGNRYRQGGHFEAHLVFARLLTIAHHADLRRQRFQPWQPDVVDVAVVDVGHAHDGCGDVALLYTVFG